MDLFDLFLLTVPDSVLREREDALRPRTFGGRPSDQPGESSVHHVQQ